jgi:hypothetical protein
MDMTREVRDIVRETLEKQFPKIKIARIDVAEHIDDDGDEILEINVIFEAEEKDFNPAELNELPRLIRPKLAEAKEHGFPLFSFIAKSDLRKMGSEAA